jgi:hypothetical protein
MLNEALENAVNNIKTKKTDKKGNYIIPLLNMKGISADKLKKINDDYRSGVLLRDPSRDNAGILGVTFVIIVGAIIGWAMGSEDGGPLDPVPPISPFPDGEVPTIRDPLRDPPVRDFDSYRNRDLDRDLGIRTPYREGLINLDKKK